MDSTPVHLTVTGFDSFYGVETNPSRLTVESISRLPVRKDLYRLNTRIFPVIYEQAEKQLRSVIRETNPDILIMVGVSRSTQTLRLERVARNLDHSDTPDNDNVVRRNQLIIEHGAPREYVSNLPLSEYSSALNTVGESTEVSDDAGGFLCNHYYFLGRHYLANSMPERLCLFVHVPNVSDNCVQNDRSTSPIDGFVQAIMLLATSMRQTLNQMRRDSISV